MRWPLLGFALIASGIYPGVPGLVLQQPETLIQVAAGRPRRHAPHVGIRASPATIVPLTETSHGKLGRRGAPVNRLPRDQPAPPCPAKIAASGLPR